MANTTANDWDEGSPAINHARRAGAAEILSLRQGTRLRLAKEHDTPSTGGVGGEHKKGSTKVYYQTSAPTQRPDASTSLGADDAGRLWVHSTTKIIKIWTGTAWADLDAALAANTEHFEALDGDGWDGTALTESGLEPGRYRVTVDGMTQDLGGSSSFTVSITVNGVTRNMTVDNAPDGTAPFSMSMFVDVAEDGVCSLTAASGVARIRAMTGHRVGL